MDQELVSEILKLEQVLYSRTNIPWDGSKLWFLFANFAGKDYKFKSSSPEDKLPPLYLE
jgi:hypothetical protein